jgi:tetratricopeptide (TPR) repeat protein
MAMVLGSLTLVLVLVVLPRRYVLHAGLRESGMSFPASAAPFVPPEELRREVSPPPILSTTIPVRGPAEVFWEEVGRLQQDNRFGDALVRFEAYLTQYPWDRSVRREYGITLDRARRPEEAVQVFLALLDEEDDPELRLILARSLRDQGRLEEASTQYGVLVDGAADDPGLTLEFARALSWGRQYDESVTVLKAYLASHPDNSEFRVELARILFWSGRVEEAAEVVEGMPDEAFEGLDAVALNEDIVAANTPPPPPPEEPVILSTVDQADRAVAEQDYEAAVGLFREALEASPSDRYVLAPYADVLQYQLGDLEGAHEALLRLEEVTEAGPVLRLRIAQLAVWTGRDEEGAERLEALLRDVETGEWSLHEYDGDFAEPQIATAEALRGDLYRWEGRRREAAAAYERALTADPGSSQSRSGLEQLADEVDDRVNEIEGPRLGTTVYSFSDSDDFTLLDLGLEGVFLDGLWVWNASSGLRVLRGSASSGGDGTERGVFAEVEGARWWRWGTMRTALHFGVEEVRPGGTDLSVGASVHWSDLAGFRTDLRFDHGPAYPLTVTLESALGRLQQNRFTLGLARRLGTDWSLSLSGDANWLDVAGSGDSGGGSLRLEAGASLSRTVFEGFELGMNTRGLSYSEGAPVLGGRRLFWDPESVLSTGVYARWTERPSELWELRTFVNPSVAFIRERGFSGFEGVPHFSAEAGFSYLGSRIRASVDAFYYQGRFEGYRAYGLRFGLSMTDWLGSGRGR